MPKLLTLVVAVLAAAAASAAVALADGSPAAGKARANHFGGAVLAVGGDSLTIEVDRAGKRVPGLPGQTLTVSVPAGTPVVLGKAGTPISLSDVQVGWRARVLAQQSSASSGWTALRVRVGRGDQAFAGVVVAVGSDSITVAVKRTGPRDERLKGMTVTVRVDSSTQIVRGPARTPIGLGDIRTGDRVGVLVHALGGDLAQALTAVRIHDRTRPATS